MEYIYNNFIIGHSKAEYKYDLEANVLFTHLRPQTNISLL